MAQTTKPSLTVLGGLLLLAAIVAIALLVSVKYGSDGKGTAPSTVLPSPAVDEIGDPNLSSSENPSDRIQTDITGSGAIATISAYDPDGDDGSENDAQAPQALRDGNDQTTWGTSCYSDQFMGGKKGVGLVVTTDGFSQSAVSVDVVNGPYIVEFFTSAADAVPTSFNGWDAQLGSVQAAKVGGIVVSDIPPSPVRHILILLEQIGNDSSCSDARPYRGRLGEIGFVG